MPAGLLDIVFSKYVHIYEYIESQVLRALPPGALTGALTNPQKKLRRFLNSQTGLDSLRTDLVGHHPANLSKAAETKITEDLMARDLVCKPELMSLKPFGDFSLLQGINKVFKS